MARKKSEPPSSRPTSTPSGTRTPGRTSRPRNSATSSATDEAAPKTMLYPRDPSLDPQLVWKGKDEQDRKDLAVDVVPIYIQEAIEPRVIVEAVQSRARTGPDNGGMLPGFYDDIGGDRLRREGRVLPARSALGEPNDPGRLAAGDDEPGGEGRAQGKVQTIYIDPPYGIKFGSNWQVSTRKRDVKDGKVRTPRVSPNSSGVPRHMELGIHSYLSYLRDRFRVAADLLRRDGLDRSFRLETRMFTSSVVF